MTLKVNLDALKDRLDGKKTDKQDQKSAFLKPKDKGTIKFRATIYPHQADPENSPFAERFYHYQIAGEPVFYCPKLNASEKCHICDYIWTAVKDLPEKQKTDWYKKLPNGSVYIPGLWRGNEVEGPKFFKVGTRKDKMSANYEKIYKFFFDEETANWLDPEKGFDLEIDYEEYDSAKSKALNNAKFGLKDLKLARKPSKFGLEPSYDEFLKQIKNIDEIFSIKTTEDSLSLLKKWNAQMGADLNKDKGVEVENAGEQKEEKSIEEVLAANGL